MRQLRRLVSRVASGLSARRFDADDERLRAEIDEHIALQTADNVRAGLPPAEARRLAVLKFGAVEGIKEHHRDGRRLVLLEQIAQDVRYAVRQMRRAPLFTMAAVMSLAVGIGANAAVFTIADRLLLKPLPVSDPEQLVIVADQRSRTGASSRFSYPLYAAFRDSAVLDGAAARFATAMTVTAGSTVTRARGELVSGNYFTVVGSGTHLGRPLSPEDDRSPGSSPVAVISDSFWRRSFAADPAVLGRAVRIGDRPFTIVGVAHQGFTGTEAGSPADVFIPMAMQRAVGRDLLNDARANWLEIIGRLAPDASAEPAAAALTTIVERQTGQGPLAASDRRRILLLPGRTGSAPVRRDVGPTLRVLLMLTGLALALACVNVAGLLAVRSTARQRELAVRLALGGGRSRLARQLLTETLVLTGSGGAVGLVLAPWAAALLLASQHGIEIDAGLDVRVFLFGVGLTVLTGAIVALAPILTTRNLSMPVASGHLAATAPGRTRLITLHDAIVACQIAASLAMLISAALLTQSFRALQLVDPGFRAEGLLLMTLDPRNAGYDGARTHALWRDMLDQIGRTHGVTSVSLARIVPLAPGRQRQPIFDPTAGSFVEVDTNVVTPGYFRTLEVPLLRGRDFGAADDRSARPVVIVNERLGRMLWPDQDPLGKTVRFAGGREEPRHVIGIVKDFKYRDLTSDTVPVIYRPLFQSGTTDPMTLHARAAGDPGTTAETIRREMQAAAPDLPLYDVRTLDDQLSASFAATRQAAALSGAFGILALLLSGIGVYGVTALAVSRQTHEIGIRVALGARPSDIARMIGRRGATLALVGLGIGLIGSFAITRFADALLFGITASDAATFAGGMLLLAAVSATAIVIPVRRATRLDPVTTIRQD